jgi:hypothetical protein
LRLSRRSSAARVEWKYRDRAIDLDDGRSGESAGRAIEQSDLLPVARFGDVQFGDGRLQDVRAGPAERGRPLEERAAFGDLPTGEHRVDLAGRRIEEPFLMDRHA